MAFGKPQQVIEEKTEFNINDQEDLAVVMAFEKELEPYQGRSITLFQGTSDEVVLKGYDIYMHEKHLFHYTDQYKSGAVVRANLDELHLVRMKKRALDSLNYKREKARSFDRERTDSLVKDKEKMERGMKL